MADKSINKMDRRVIGYDVEQKQTVTVFDSFDTLRFDDIWQDLLMLSFIVGRWFVMSVSILSGRREPGGRSDQERTRN